VQKPLRKYLKLPALRRALGLRERSPSWDHQFDSALLVAIAQGDDAAFRDLVERHVDRAFRLALRFLDDRASAEAVTAALFVEIWEKPALCSEPESPFKIWLCGAVLKRCRLAEPAAKPRSADGSLRPGPVGDDLMAALRELSWQERAVVLLAYQERFSNPDVALALGIVEADVATLAAAARRSLRARLSDSRMAPWKRCRPARPRTAV
jgi:RNA polymerase sigma-70 factor (ECF subfamily)